VAADDRDARALLRRQGVVVTSLRASWARIFGRIGRRRRERELDDELASHLEMHTEENIRRGMTPEEARRAAVLKLGGLEQTKELCRDQRSLPAVEMIIQDGRHALRVMRRNRGLTAVAMLVLALGIGANTVMFSVVNSVLLRPLPYPEPSRLQLVQSTDEDGDPVSAAPPDYYAYRDRNRAFDSLAAFYSRPFDVTGGEDPERIRALIVSSEFLAMLRTPPALGRDLLRADEHWGGHRVVILTDAFWRARFAGNPAIVGRPIALNAEQHTVVGILPAGFSFIGLDAQVVVPMAFAPGDNMNSHNNYFLNMVGRLRPEATPAAARADLDRIHAQIVAEYPQSPGRQMEIESLQAALVEDVKGGLLVLFAAVVFVLLIACADLANLLMARASARRREIALRIAIGASRRRVLGQLLTESVVLALCGSALALALAWLSVGMLNSLDQSILPRTEHIRIDGVVLAYTALVAVVTGVLFGIAPAWRSIDVDPGDALHEGARTGGDALVAAEIAMSLVLLVGAGLMIKSVHGLTRVEAGFDPRNVITAQLSIPRRRYVDEELERQFSPLAYAKATRFYSDVVEQVRAVPGVTAAGAINGLPLMGDIWGKYVTLYDRPLPATLRELPEIQYRVVAGDFFRALDVAIMAGRPFNDADTADGAKVAIVNREMVRLTGRTGTRSGRSSPSTRPRTSFLRERCRPPTSPRSTPWSEWRPTSATQRWARRLRPSCTSPSRRDRRGRRPCTWWPDPRATPWRWPPASGTASARWTATSPRRASAPWRTACRRPWRRRACTPPSWARSRGSRSCSRASASTA
jgi:predicted permease